MCQFIVTPLSTPRQTVSAESVQIPGRNVWRAARAAREIEFCNFPLNSFVLRRGSGPFYRHAKKQPALSALFSISLASTAGKSVFYRHAQWQHQQLGTTRLTDSFSLMWMSSSTWKFFVSVPRAAAKRGRARRTTKRESKHVELFCHPQRGGWHSHAVLTNTDDTRVGLGGRERTSS